MEERGRSDRVAASLFLYSETLHQDSGVSVNHCQGHARYLPLLSYFFRVGGDVRGPGGNGCAGYLCRGGQ